MIVVADTSPLNYLVLVDQIQVLESLYGRIAIPAAVHQELLSPKAPHAVRNWAAALPTWIEVHTATAAPLELSAKLDAGEREAIGLALTLGSSVLIIDEAIGRREAQACGLRVIGTLGILRDAHGAQLLDLKTSLKRLQATNFHVAANTLDAILRGS
jgi:predicted nucleic acid-binding protein